MAPFTLASLSEAFTILMNTPLVPAEPGKAPRDVPLTEMPASTRHLRENRRQSIGSATMTTASSRSSASARDGSNEHWTYSSSSNSTPSRVSSKELPPLPAGARHQSHVHFADA